MKSIVVALLMAAALVACDGNDFVAQPPGTTSSGGSGSSSAGGSAGESGSGSGSSGTGSGSSSSGGSSNGSGTGSESGNSTNTGGSGTTTNNAALNVSHRNGQTFIVWREVDDRSGYHVYRHNAPITNSNLGSATRLTDRWGPLDQNTSVNLYGGSIAPDNFVIRDSAQPLNDNQGLFVHTTQNNEQGNAYYAVTSVVGGRENRSIAPGQNATTQPIGESVSTPRPVLAVSANGGKGRVYTQYMDYSKWNPTLKGYAFNFSVALPGNYNPSQSYPLRVYLHAYGEAQKFVNQSEFNWPVIQLFPSDPGEDFNTLHTWWYGFSRDHNYKTQGAIPRSGVIENFTEQRVLASVDFLINDGQFNVDRNLVHAYGHSMGGSGVLAFGMRYPSVFAGIYASEPMTNYGASPMFQENFRMLWGERSANLPIVNNGRNNSAISNYDSTGSRPTRVWDWMNHQGQLNQRRGDRFSFLMVDHGKADRVIDWQTQGRPMAQVLSNARVGFSAATLGGVDHSWLAFNSVVTDVFGFGNGAEAGWLYPRNLSFPGIANASGSGRLLPGGSGDDRYNTNLEWSTPRNNFHQNIVDSANRYEISLRSKVANQTADVTPRNTNSFRPSSGTRCSWTARSIANNSTLGSGNSVVDGSRLLTIPNVSILGGSGTRLAISCP